MEEQNLDPACTLQQGPNPWGPDKNGAGVSWYSEEGSAGGHAGFGDSAWHTLGWGKPCKT